MTDWVSVIRDVGFPIGLVMLLLSAGWKLASWTASNVIVPLRDAHINFLNSLENTQKSHAATLSHLADLYEQHSTEIRTVRELLENGKG